MTKQKSGTIIAVCASEKRGTPKKNIERGVLQENHGLLGDAHAGQKIRQVSLFASEDLEAFAAQHQAFECGDFGENITTKDIDLSLVSIGTVLCVGDAYLEVTQIGKECTTPCAIYQKHGACALPSKGVFARVTKSGSVACGDSIAVCDNARTR